MALGKACFTAADFEKNEVRRILCLILFWYTSRCGYMEGRTLTPCVRESMLVGKMMLMLEV